MSDPQDGAHAHRSEAGYHTTLSTARELVAGAGDGIRGLWTRFRADCGCDGRKTRLVAAVRRIVGG